MTVFTGSEKNILCPGRDLNPRPHDCRLGVITTTPLEQPCWLHGQCGAEMRYWLERP